MCSYLFNAVPNTHFHDLSYPRQGNKSLLKINEAFPMIL